MGRGDLAGAAHLEGRLRRRRGGRAHSGQARPEAPDRMDSLGRRHRPPAAPPHPRAANPARVPLRTPTRPDPPARHQGPVPHHRTSPARLRPRPGAVRPAHRSHPPRRARRSPPADHGQDPAPQPGTSGLAAKPSPRSPNSSTSPHPAGTSKIKDLAGWASPPLGAGVPPTVRGGAGRGRRRRWGMLDSTGVPLATADTGASAATGSSGSAGPAAGSTTSTPAVSPPLGAVPTSSTATPSGTPTGTGSASPSSSPSLAPVPLDALTDLVRGLLDGVGAALRTSG